VDRLGHVKCVKCNTNFSTAFDYVYRFFGDTLSTTTHYENFFRRSFRDRTW